MSNVSAKSEKNTTRQASRQMYAQKPVVKVVVRPSPDSQEMIMLKKLTSKVLDDLKNPSLIPSVVILDALIQARSK
jgi:hypothetical protein